MKSFCFIPSTVTTPPAILRDCQLVSDMPGYFMGRVSWCPVKSYHNLQSYIMHETQRKEYDTLEEAIADNITELL